MSYNIALWGDFMARYSLIAENKKTGNKVLIGVKETDNSGITSFKDKVNLSTIDRYTLNFESEEQLSTLLKGAGVIPFEDAHFYIEYASKGKKVQLPVVYKELENLVYFANNAPGKVSIVDPVYIRTINEFLAKVIEPEYFRFLVSNQFLHEYNAEYVKKYIELVSDGTNPREIDHLRSLIYTLLNRYKRIRGLMIGDMKYAKTALERHIENMIPDEEQEIVEVYDKKDKDLDVLYGEMGMDLEDLERLAPKTKKMLGLEF